MKWWMETDGDRCSNFETNWDKKSVHFRQTKKGMFCKLETGLGRKSLLEINWEGLFLTEEKMLPWSCELANLDQGLSAWDRLRNCKFESETYPGRNYIYVPLLV